MACIYFILYLLLLIASLKFVILRSLNMQRSSAIKKKLHFCVVDVATTFRLIHATLFFWCIILKEREEGFIFFLKITSFRHSIIMERRKPFSYKLHTRGIDWSKQWCNNIKNMTKFCILIKAWNLTDFSEGYRLLFLLITLFVTCIGPLYFRCTC